MPPPKQPPDDVSPDPATPTTPRRTAAIKQKPNNGVSTPPNRRPPAGQTPRSAPAFVPAANRQRSQSQKNQPTLLADFLLGRQTPARVAAVRESQRRRSVDAAAVREELRLEMRRSSVQRLAQPNGVGARVKAWQRSNAYAMAKGDPEAAPSEPTEVGVQIDAESVTEEDRIRIKKGRPRKPKKPKPTNERVEVDDDDDHDEGTGEDEDDRDDDALGESRLNDPPKKRIVSDDNWMKRRRKSPRGAGSPKPKVQGTGSPIPKDFLQRTAQNPTVQNKIKDWGVRVETPSPPEKPRTRQYRTKTGDTVTVEEGGSSGKKGAPNDGIRVSPMPSGEARAGATPAKDGDSGRMSLSDDGIRVRPMRTKTPKEGAVESTRDSSARKKELAEEAIQRTPRKNSPLPDDGIRVRPGRKVSSDDTTVRAASSSSLKTTTERSARRDPSPSDRIEVVEESDSVLETPTRRSKSKRGSRMLRGKSAPSLTETQTEGVTDDKSWSESGSSAGDRNSEEGSYQPSSAPAKSLADIPFGYSAFSELDLPMGTGVRRPKAQRNPSFKAAVPKVLKKVVTEGKKILQHEKAVEPPRTGVNQPPSIENWLSGTVDPVDPFIDAPAPKRSSIEQEWKQDARKRSSSETGHRESKEVPPSSSDKAPEQENQENADPRDKVDEDQTPKKEAVVTPKATGLKRSRATRSPSSPLKGGGVKKPFREVLREAFRGESGGHTPPMIFARCADDSTDIDREAEDEERREPRRRSAGSQKRTPSPEPAASSVDSSVDSDPPQLPGCFPRRRPPPTNGMHELSTIVSEESLSTHLSDTMSDVSETTVTQTTAWTKSTDLSRQRSNKSGLKRRLTKHSDLVSVLSLPDDGQLPARTKSIKVARSLHRKTSKLDDASLDDLLREFTEDENLYQRELKTLVDGVVPVLLTQFVHGAACNAAELFGPGSGSSKADTMARAVVNMGVALEKLKKIHKRVPLHDAQGLLTWLEAAYPVYNNYLDVWRLGFQDIIVNLAPAAGRLDDEDSLVNAMARNEDGDVLDENGERVDVAHLLKKPLIRIKWMLKFAKGAHIMLEGNSDKEIVRMLEELQAKARRRHREETARKADEDANSTDTTRTRDLRNLVALGNVRIDQTRQVSAKDYFSLDLSHSSGQRLECQVELVFRDKPGDPRDQGDVLVRETGSGGRSWLLFPPVLSSHVSARRGENSRSLVMMIRGAHNGEDWHELLTLLAECEDSATEWLDILGKSPIPPSAASTALARTRQSAPSPMAAGADVPVGERKTQQQPPPPGSPARSSASPTPSHEPARAKTPSRYHQRVQSLPSTPTAPSPPTAARSPSLRKTSMQPAQQQSPDAHPLPQPPAEPSSRSLREDMRPDPSTLKRQSPNSTPPRDDGAPPPPPAHRTLAPKKPASMIPPLEPPSAPRVRRRTSSPLKHEYRPSDGSSDDSTSESSGSGSESSSDELDEDDVPDTLPGISIKGPNLPAVIETAESVVSDSSLTPSNSASQAGLPYLRAASPEYTIKTVAAISYWSNKKGLWKQVCDQACSISITPGLVEAHPLNSVHSNNHAGPLQSSGSSDAARGDMDAGAVRPLIALDLTPVVIIRKSTGIDLEIRSPTLSYSLLNKIDGSFFRFRTATNIELETLYAAVHNARMNNAKYKALEQEARFRSFGQPQTAAEAGDDSSSSSRRRSWFGRKNSYRASTRAPSQSQGSGSSISASSFLKRLTGGGNPSFNIDKSSVDQQSRAGSGGGASFYTSGSSSMGGATPPRSPSVSMAESGGRGIKVLGSDNLKVRCHLLVSHNKWEDHGNCRMSISRPPPGVRQELSLYNGMEKRVIITSIPRKESDKPLIVLDVVVGSQCFHRLAARGIVLNVWEDLRDEHNNVGSVPKEGGVSGKVKKWCFQCPSVAEAGWIYGLLAQEVMLS